MEIIILLCLILLNGILSMSEIALVSVRKSHLEADAKKGSRSANTALKLYSDPDRFLSTVQIGITLIGILTGLYSGEAFADDFAKVIGRSEFLAPYSDIIAKTIIVIVVTYLTLVLGELVPKRWGMSRAESVSKAVARPMYGLSRIASPVVWLLSKSTSLFVSIFGIRADESNKVTEDEIKAIVKEGMDTGEVQEVEHDIVGRVFTLGDRDVGSIMTHRGDLVWLDLNDSGGEIRKKVAENMHYAYPVGNGNRGELLGAVFLRDIFEQVDSPGFSLEKLVTPGQFLPDNQSVYNTLEQFRKSNLKYGFVADEFGNMQGIVTLKDIFEALVGHIVEDVSSGEIVKSGDGGFIVDGQYPFYDFLEYFDKENLYPHHEYNTLSGLILGVLGRMPSAGEKISWHGFNMEITAMAGARIDKVKVTLKQ